MPGADRTNRQRRCLPVEYSTREEGGELYIEGYFAVFNSPYEFWPGASEVILPGAFDESVSGDVRALVSYPARGTWIEITCSSAKSRVPAVVPRTGYVDRNSSSSLLPEGETGRTPHGVRG